MYMWITFFSCWGKGREGECISRKEGGREGPLGKQIMLYFHADHGVRKCPFAFVGHALVGQHVGSLFQYSGHVSFEGSN